VARGPSQCSARAFARRPLAARRCRRGDLGLAGAVLIPDAPVLLAGEPERNAA
jgi:hypothetical protein